MSYILDALKKAEQERRRGKAPDIMTNPDDTGFRPQKRLWPYALLIILVAAAGSLGWFFGRVQTDTPSPITPQVTHNYVLPMPPQPQSTIQPATPLAETTSGTQPTSASGGSRAAKEERSTSPNNTLGPLYAKPNLSKNRVTQPPADRRGASAKKQEPIATLKTSQDRSAEVIQPQPGEKAVPDNKIYTISELPEAVRQGLPSLTISTHVYSSEKSERLTAINGHIGREGQEVMIGIMLETITPDGVILRYQGYKFRVGLK